jgi:Xaa-Pro aminopeptidase
MKKRTNKKSLLATSETIYSKRRKSLRSQIKGAVAILPAASLQYSSRDLLHPFHQDSDFFYFTGFNEPDAVLVLRGANTGPRSVLFLNEKDPVLEKWNGERLGTKRAKKKFQVDEILDIATLDAVLPTLIKGADTIHYALGSSEKVDKLVLGSLKSKIAPQPGHPHGLRDSRVFTSQMRAIKDRYELRAIRHAIEITSKSLLQLLPQLKSMSSELHATRELEALYARFGATGLAFPTIIAAGKNATVLHHQPKHQPLWKRELVLIDTGASFKGYNADISRTVPVSGKFTETQAEIYDLVHEALKAACNKAKPGSSLEAIHEAAVKTLTTGLCDLKILRGNPADRIADGSYKRFYMHRTGHWLGLDVHDISPLFEKNGSSVSSYLQPLVAGNVFTIEPGLYFDPKDAKTPAEYRGIGIRLEENIVITENGCEVLTSHVPIERNDIEQLMA